MEDSQDPDIEITTSIRSDITLTESGVNTTLSGTATEPCQFYMLSYHRDRMLSTAAEFAWIEAFKVLDGADGLRLLKNTLHEHLAHTYGDHNHPDRIKVQRLTHTHFCCYLTTNSTSSVSCFLESVSSMSNRLLLLLCFSHFSFPFFFLFCHSPPPPSESTSPLA